MKKKPQDSRKGFTLLEVMIALAILALIAAGLVRVTGETVRQEAAFEAKNSALLVAQNKLAELRLSPVWPQNGESDESTELAGRRWAMHVTISDTFDADLRRVDISVGANGSPVVLTGFIGKAR